MASEHWLPSLGDQNGPAPFVTEANVSEHRMKLVDSLLEADEKVKGFALAYVDVRQVPPIFEMDQPAAENNLISVKQASPQIRQVYSVKRFARS
jgi:hypothetical protein